MRDFRVQEVCTIQEAIRYHAQLRSAWPAIVASESLPLSYGELFEKICAVRGDLYQAGFDRNSRVVIALQNGPLAALAVVAVACSAAAVPIDIKLTLPEVDRSFAVIRPAAVVLLKDTPSPARTIAERRDTPIIELASPDREKLGLNLVIPRVGNAASPAEPIADMPAFIQQTSSTTGQPKLIPYSHRNMLAAASRVQGWFGLTSSDRCLSVSPIHYSHGIKFTTFTPLITGGSLAFPLDASRLDIAEWFGELRPTWYSAGPTLHRYVLDKTKSLSEARTIHNLRFVVSAGASLPEDVGVGLQRVLGVPVLQQYGTAETAQVSANLPPPGAAKLGTCGIPPKNTVIIVREDGSQAAPGHRGEVWVRGPTVMSGYLEDPELNRAAFVDGWFRTGDIGSLDEDGFLTLHGREKELINRGGEKIAPTEIDKALMRHPAVLEAAAYAVHHPRLGEDVAAAVVLKPGSTVAEDDLRKFLSTQLASFKIPRHIVFQDKLPKGSTGKLQRQKLGDRS
jgi:acyl-CoA synthetase (AMP-forming)/AMP-acid ligase II